MGFDRNAFKGASLNEVNDEVARTGTALPVVDYQSNRTDFHKIVEGKNYRRVAPSIDPGKSPYRGCSSTMLECEVPEVDVEGKETGKTTLRKKKIFIAPQHSKTMKDDPVLVYIEFVTAIGVSKFPTDRKERDKFLGVVNGYQSPQGWVWGIRPVTEFICYSWDSTGLLGRDNLYPSMMDGIKKMSADMSDPSKPFIPDIFSDPDEGYNLIISKDKNEKGKFIYSVACEQLGRNENWEQFFARTRVTDEMIINLSEKESLSALYDNVYSKRDYNLAVNGLKLFDDKYKFGVFSDKTFLARLAIIAGTAPEFVSKYNTEAKPAAVVTKPVVVEAKPVVVEAKLPSPQGYALIENQAKPVVVEAKPVVVGAAPEKMVVPVFKMKKDIRAYVETNYGLEFRVLLDGLSDGQVKELHQLVLAGEELPGVIENSAEDTGIAPQSTPVTARPEQVPGIDPEVYRAGSGNHTIAVIPEQVPGIDPEPTVPRRGGVSVEMAQQIEDLRRRRQKALEEVRNKA